MLCVVYINSILGCAMQSLLTLILKIQHTCTSSIKLGKPIHVLPFFYSNKFFFYDLYCNNIVSVNYLLNPFLTGSMGMDPNTGTP